MITCERCGRAAPVDDDREEVEEVPLGDSGEITASSDAPSGVNMPTIDLQPAGFLPDPDDPSKFICRGCATRDELDELTPAERRIAYLGEDEDPDEPEPDDL